MLGLMCAKSFHRDLSCLRSLAGCKSKKEKKKKNRRFYFTRFFFPFSSITHFFPLSFFLSFLSFPTPFLNRKIYGHCSRVSWGYGIGIYLWYILTARSSSYFQMIAHFHRLEMKRYPRTQLTLRADFTDSHHFNIWIIPTDFSFLTLFITATFYLATRTNPLSLKTTNIISHALNVATHLAIISRIIDAWLRIACKKKIYKK